VEFHHLACNVIGSHWGKNKALKTVGTLGRAARLGLLAIKEKPDLAISLVSRAQLLACKALGIPTIVMFDYEFVMKMQFLRPDWIFVPEVMPDSGAGVAKREILRYPGLKEDVYVPRFKPDATMRTQLGISETDLLVTVRPPATEAHYHNPESEKLLSAALHFLTHQPDVRVVLLPRNHRQGVALQKEWGDWIEKGKIVIPEHVVDGLNLIWFSDLVISGGGTMNREAAALGVPVYSIFRGKIGAVDRYLVEKGRLVLIERDADVQTKIVLARRCQVSKSPNQLVLNTTLQTILDGIISIAEFDYRSARMTQDRRSMHRYPLQIPLEVRLGPQGHAHASTATTTNISISGIYFVSDQHCEIGTEFGATIRWPGEITGGTDLLVELQGKVERIDRLEGKGAARNGIAVSIDRYDSISA
jgi:predicted glycosyltransferase